MAVEIIEQIPRALPKQKMSFEEFLEWCDGTWAEWVAGEIVMASAASIQHQQIGGLLEIIMRIYVEAHSLGVVLRAPFAMRMKEIARSREPDLLFIAEARTHLLQKNYLDGPADLAVEIVSPESIGRDRGEKFVEYERVGIREYWLLDPERQSADFYELGADARYHLAWLDNDIFRSQVIPGFWLRTGWLWQTPPPPALDLLRELKIV